MTIEPTPAPVSRLCMMLYAQSPQDRPARNNFMAPVDLHDTAMPLDFYCWVAVSGDRVVLIDSGCDRETCERRGNRFLRCPTRALAGLGIAPEQVTDVVVTHMHWDHLGNLEKFPAARIHVHETEMAFATGPCMCHGALRAPYDVEQVCTLLRALYADRVSFTDGPREIAPGITVHPVGGHAPGLQVVTADTARGRVVLASDAMHLFANGALGNPYPVVVDVRAYLDGLDTVRALAADPALIVPGHDPLLRGMYPAVPGTDAAWDLARPPLHPNPEH